jgi:hypothetical protein
VPRKKQIIFVSISITMLASGCGAGFNASTMQTQPANPGIYSSVGAMDVQNAMIVVTGENTAKLLSTFINTGAEPDQLLGVTVSGPAPQDIVTDYQGPLEIPAGAAVVVGPDLQPQIELVGFAPAESSYVKVDFLFAKAGELSVSLLTVPPTAAFAELAD